MINNHTNKIVFMQLTNIPIQLIYQPACIMLCYTAFLEVFCHVTWQKAC